MHRMGRDASRSESSAARGALRAVSTFVETTCVGVDVRIQGSVYQKPPCDDTSNELQFSYIVRPTTCGCGLTREGTGRYGEKLSLDVLGGEETLVCYGTAAFPEMRAIVAAQATKGFLPHVPTDVPQSEQRGRRRHARFFG